MSSLIEELKAKCPVSQETIEENGVIFRQGFPAKVTIVESGYALLYRHFHTKSRNHYGRINYGVLRPSDILSGSDAILEEVNSYSARALTGMKIGRINPGDFEDLMKVDPDLATKVMFSSFQLVQKFQDRLLVLPRFSVKANLARFLLDNAEPDGFLPGTFTQEMLADSVAARRETVNPLISSFEEAIEIMRGGRIRISSQENLFKIAQGERLHLRK